MQATRAPFEQTNIIESCNHCHGWPSPIRIKKGNLSKAINVTCLNRDAVACSNFNVDSLSDNINVVDLEAPLPIPEYIEADVSQRRQWTKSHKNVGREGCTGQPRRGCAQPRTRFAEARCQTAPQRVCISPECSAPPSCGREKIDKSVGVVGVSRTIRTVRCQTSYLCSFFARRPPSANSNAQSIGVQPSFGSLCNRFVQCTPMIYESRLLTQDSSVQAYDKMSRSSQACMSAPVNTSELHCVACQQSVAACVSTCVQCNGPEGRTVGVGGAQHGSLTSQASGSERTRAQDSRSGSSCCECTVESQCPMHCSSVRLGEGCPVPDHELNTAYKYYSHLLFKQLSKIKSNFQKHLQPNSSESVGCSYAGSHLCPRCSPRHPQAAAVNTLHANNGYSTHSSTAEQHSDCRVDAKEVETILRSIYFDSDGRALRDMAKVSKQLVELFSAGEQRGTRNTCQFEATGSCSAGCTRGLMNVSDDDTDSSTASRSYNKRLYTKKMK